MRCDLIVQNRDVLVARARDNVRQRVLPAPSELE
jgi:hypothetical protein